MTSGNGDQPDEHLEGTDVDAETLAQDEADIQQLRELADEEYGD